MNSTGPAAAWAEFWASQCRLGGGGCLASRGPTLDEAQRGTWQAFARKLRPRSHVLDLATGDGRVMGWMLSARRDLKLMGVDLAPKLPEPPRGVRSRGGIAMESLPFPDQSRDAVVSQFGFEYSEIDATLSEVARVVRKGGKVVLMTHRLHGPILEHNLRRSAALAWAVDEAQFVEKARACLAISAMSFGVPPVIAAAPAEAKRRFPEQSAAWEVTESIVRTLALAGRESALTIDRMLVRIESMARNEMTRIDALRSAAERIADEEGFIAGCGRNGLRVDQRDDLRDSTASRPFATVWSMTRA